MSDYAEEIEAAYCNAPDAFRIGITVQLRPDDSKTKVTSKISFINSKTEDSQSWSVDEAQAELPF